MRKGFTLVELLVVIAVIAILIGLLVPAVQMVRETARRSDCTNRMRQVSIAVQSYESAHSQYPKGLNFGHSFLTRVLPYIEENNLHSQFRFDLSPWQDPNLQLGMLQISDFVCPSDGENDSLSGRNGATNYLGNPGTGYQVNGYDGFFENNDTPIGNSDIRDGLSNTTMISECLVGSGSTKKQRRVFDTPPFQAPNEFDLFVQACEQVISNGVGGSPWLRGRGWSISGDYYTFFNHVLPPNSGNCTNGGSTKYGAYSAASFHPSGVNVSFGDAHVEFIASGIDIIAWRALGSRNGSEVVSDY